MDAEDLLEKSEEKQVRLMVDSVVGADERLR